MVEHYISAEKLKAHFSWWSDDNEYKKVFNDIIDCQPSIELDVEDGSVSCPACGKALNK